MAKREKTPTPLKHRVSEDVVFAPGEIITTVYLTENEVDALAEGICPEELAERMWRLNSYKRDYERMTAREKAAS